MWFNLRRARQSRRCRESRDRQRQRTRRSKKQDTGSGTFQRDERNETVRLTKAVTNPTAPPAEKERIYKP